MGIISQLFERSHHKRRLVYIIYQRLAQNCIQNMTEYLNNIQKLSTKYLQKRKSKK